ncbi:MAG TPA: hypothetical protein VGD65_24255 [Chryseosolibacter sp.]
MKRFLPAILIVCSITALLTGCDTTSNIDDPNDSHFIKYYGGDGNQSSVDMLALPDGNILLLGNTQFAGEKSIYLLKVDAKGQLLWEKTFEGTNEVAVDMEPMQDGNVAILATVEVTSDNHDIKLIVVSDGGDEVRSAVYGTWSGKKDTPKSLTPLTDGGFIVTGLTIADKAVEPKVNPDFYSNVFHFRCNSLLEFDDVTWSELYGATEQVDGGVKTFENLDGFYVFGYSDQKFKPEQGGNLGMFYYRIASVGTPSEDIGILGDEAQNIRTDFVHQVRSELGGGFLVVGSTINPSGTSSALHVARLRPQLDFNPAKDKQFDREIGVLTTSLEGVSATTSLVTPQGFLVLGEETRSLGTKNLSLIKIDQVGQVVWSVSLGSEEENDDAAAVIETSDEKILVLGTVELGDNQSKMALFKLNSTGRLHD